MSSCIYNFSVRTEWKKGGDSRTRKRTQWLRKNWTRSCMRWKSHVRLCRVTVRAAIRKQKEAKGFHYTHDMNMAWAFKVTFGRYKPHPSMVLAQISYAILYFITEASFNQGLNPHVYVTYRYILERYLHINTHSAAFHLVLLIHHKIKMTFCFTVIIVVGRLIV